MDEKGACSSHLYRFMFIEEPYTVRYKDNKEDELEYKNIALLIQSIQVKDVDKLLCTMELQLICRERMQRSDWSDGNQIKTRRAPLDLE